jgi:hypothetical protein
MHPLTDQLPDYLDALALRQACGEIEERLTRERDEFQRMAVANGLAGLEMGREIDALRAEVEALRNADGPWKAAVIDGLVVSHCIQPEHETDPRKALDDLISWHVAVALDPCVSSDAVKLLDAEAEACAGIVDDTVRAVDAADALAAIRARIAARKGGAKP